MGGVDAPEVVFEIPVDLKIICLCKMWVPYIYICIYIYICNINSLFHWKFLNCFPNLIMQNFKVWNEQIVGEKGDWKPQKNRWPVLRMPPLQAYEKPDATSAGRLSAEVLKRWRAKKTSWASALLGRKKDTGHPMKGPFRKGNLRWKGVRCIATVWHFHQFWWIATCCLFMFLPFDHWNTFACRFGSRTMQLMF